MGMAKVQKKQQMTTIVYSCARGRICCSIDQGVRAVARPADTKYWYFDGVENALLLLKNCKKKTIIWQNDSSE